MIEHIAIDSTLGMNREDAMLLEGILTSREVVGKKLLLLQFKETNAKVKELLGSIAEFDTIELENKRDSGDIKAIFQHFASVEGKDVSDIHSRLQFGKKILYLDAVSNSFIRRFESSQECPGFWNLAVGTFCQHRCLYCFLNLTMRIRPLCVEHLNLSLLKNDLIKLSKKRGNEPALLNAGETSDPLDNELLLQVWNKIVDLVRYSGNQLLCLTKSDHVYNVPETDGNNLAKTVIYSWSINPSLVAHRYELDTAPTEARLAASRYLKDLGYRIRFRIDPILPLDLMDRLAEGQDSVPQEINLEEYYKLVDEIAPIEPELITLGTFRALPTLFNFIKDKTLRKRAFIKSGKRFRLSDAIRLFIYEKIGAYVLDTVECRIAICKDPSIPLPFATMKVPCQCMQL